MNGNKQSASKCSNCRFFSPDGCHHGYCSHLNVPVEGKWSPCVLFEAAFSHAERQEKLPDLACIAA